MKEFTSQTGGRYTYIDDIVNLQDLSLAFASIFDDCDNFIISGCEVSDSAISAGYVYLNGKIRYCSGTKSAQFPMYIYENDSQEYVSYVDSGDKVGRNVYGCVLGSSVPETLSPLTGNNLQAISIASDGTAVRLKDALFGKYAMLLNSNNTQIVNGDVKFSSLLTAKSATIQDNLSISDSKKVANVRYENNTLIIESNIVGGDSTQIQLTSSGSINFVKNKSTIASIDSTGCKLYTSLLTYTLTSNMIATQDLRNVGTMSDDGAININLVGYNGGANYYRKTVIGDGKGVAVLSVDGKSHSTTLSGSLVISANKGALATLKNPDLAKSDKTLMSYLQWVDKSDDVMATVGYSSDNQNYYIKNLLGDVIIDNDAYITGMLYVNGINVTSSFVSTDTYTEDMAGKANVSDVYSRESADNTFMKRTDSLSLFVENDGAESIRKMIDVPSTSDLGKAMMIEQSLKDVVSYGLPSSTTAGYTDLLNLRQRTLCDNIGAAYKGDIITVKDTGWQSVIADTTYGAGLKVRQFGCVVSIHGEFKTLHTGKSLFTLPNNIDPPTCDVVYTNDTWSCKIAAGSYECVVVNCHGDCNKGAKLLMTYLA